MPHYSVKMKDHHPVSRKWEHVYFRIVARNPKMAMAQAEMKSLSPGLARYTAISARQIRSDRNKWRKIWLRALDNMPVRISSTKDVRWIEQPPGSVPIPVFIKDRAWGIMRRDDNTGIIYKKEVKKRVFKQGQLAALTRLLGYQTGASSHSIAHMTVSKNINNGAIPKTKERRELLLKLAGKDGTRHALRLLRLRFEPLKLRKV